MKFSNRFYFLDCQGTSDRFDMLSNNILDVDCVRRVRAGRFRAGSFCAGSFCAGSFCAGSFCAGSFCAIAASHKNGQRKNYSE